MRRDPLLDEINDRYRARDVGTPAVIEIVGITATLTVILFAAVLILQALESVL